MLTARPAPVNCQVEPPYPHHDTVLMSFVNPELTAHRANTECSEESPHSTHECPLWMSRDPARRDEAQRTHQALESTCPRCEATLVASGWYAECTGCDYRRLMDEQDRPAETVVESNHE